MAANISMYRSAVLGLGSGMWNFTSDTLKLALLNTSGSFNSSHDYYNDVSANEITGTGYTAGGATLTTVTWTNPSGTYVMLDADNVLWSGATFSTRYGVVYKSTGVTSTSPLLIHLDFTSTQSPSAVPFQITWSSQGLFILDNLV